MLKLSSRKKKKTTTQFTSLFPPCFLVLEPTNATPSPHHRRRHAPLPSPHQIIGTACPPAPPLAVQSPELLSCVCLLSYSLNIRSSDNVSPNRPADTSHGHPPPGEERPPPPYPLAASCHHASAHHFYPKAPPCARPVAPGPESQPPASPPPVMRWSGFTPPVPAPAPPPAPPSSSSSSSSSSLDINSNPKPSCLLFPKHSPPGEVVHAPPPDANASPLYIKTPLVLSRHDQPLGNPPSLPSSAPPPPPWAACPCVRERGPPRLTR